MYLPISPQTCTQELPNCMIITICSLVPGVSRKGNMACPPIPFNSITCHSPVHFCLYHLFWNYKHSLPSFIILGPILHIQTARAVDFILSLALLYMNTFIATPTSICTFHIMSVHSLHKPGIWSGIFVFEIS